MILCLDIHTHHPAPQPMGVISATIEDFNPIENQLYSIGIHPWTTQTLPTKEEWEKFEALASHPSVAAIGECGIDKVKGGPMYKQLIVMKRQIDISEKLGKPLIIHDVKAHDVIVGLRRELPLTQKWVVHGFRGKATVAKMLTDAGIYLSFGEKFNPAALPIVPKQLILAETDESPLTIQEVIENLSTNLFGSVSGALNETNVLIEANTQRFLYNI